GDDIERSPVRLGTIALVPRGDLLDQIVGQGFRVGEGRLASLSDDRVVLDRDGCGDYWSGDGRRHCRRGRNQDSDLRFPYGLASRSRRASLKSRPTGIVGV